MDDQQRRDGGMVQRRKILGNAWVDKSIANRNSFNTDFQDLITRYAWGEIWTRPHFDERTRRVLAIGTLVALGIGSLLSFAGMIMASQVGEVAACQLHATELLMLLGTVIVLLVPSRDAARATA